MKPSGILWIGLLFLTFTGCSTMRVTSDYDPAASLTTLRTYDWIPGPVAKTGDPRIDDNLLDKRVHEAVDSWFVQNGYCKKTTESADFWVGYHVTLDKKTKISDLNDYYSYSPGWGSHYGYRYLPYSTFGSPTRSVYQYDQGTLILDIVDPNTRKLLWRGSATDEVNLSSSPEKKREKIFEAVNKILEQFPPH